VSRPALSRLSFGRTWLSSVPHMQVGVEERKNLTVTGNASITRRSLCVTLLAAILALVFVVILAEDADAIRRRSRFGAAEFCDVIGCANIDFHGTGKTGAELPNPTPFHPPDRFICRPGQPVTVVLEPKPIDGYVCAAVGSVGSTQTATFDLNDVLARVVGQNAPLGPGLGATATPDLFHCNWVPNPAGERFANNFSCKFHQNHQTRVFTMNEMVATNVDDEPPCPPAGCFHHLDPVDLFFPPPGRAVPIAVPAGADAAGEGSATWLFGLALAATGAILGTVLIVRRRILHDS
jgi:hypothetical protein